MTWRSSLRGVDAAAIAGLLAVFGLLHWLWNDPWGVDLQPTPDAVEYVGTAQSILRHGVPALEMSDGSLYPSRYNTGFPALLALWMLVTGESQTAGLSLNLLLGFGAALLTYLAGRHIAGRLGAFAAALLLILCPRMGVMTGHIMSDPLAVFLVMAITAIAIARAERGGALSAIAIGALAGYLCAVRLTHVINLVYLLPAALLLRRHGRLRDFGWGLVGFLPLPILMGALQWWLNGGITRQGYDLWAPYATSLGEGWSWRFFLSSHMEPWEIASEARVHPHIMTYVPMMLGLVPRGYVSHMLWPWPIAVGVVWAMVEMRGPLRRGWAWAVLAGLAINFAVWSLYYYWAARFFLPMLPVVLLLGCRGLEPKRGAGWSVGNITKVALLILALCQQTTAAILYLQHQRPWALSERRALEALDEITSDDAVVIVDAFSILAQDVLMRNAPNRRVMNWAIDGRDLLLWESRLYEVPALRAGHRERPLALFNAEGLRTQEMQLVLEQLIRGREVWLALYDPINSYFISWPGDEIYASRLETLRNQMNVTHIAASSEANLAFDFYRCSFGD